VNDLEEILICKIARLGVDIPLIGDLKERCTPYFDDVSIDIVLNEKDIQTNKWPELSERLNIYLDSGALFSRKILYFDGMMLHSSAVLVDGKAFLFSGPSGIGKSTHVKKYLETFSDAIVINDDKPCLRYIQGTWYAFGTPWCGKDGLNNNIEAPVAGICFLHRGDRRIVRLSPMDVVRQILKQTTGRSTKETAELLMVQIDRLIRDIPFFDFYCHAEDGDEWITFRTLSKG